jgi:ribosome maturation factor RimP
VAGSYTLEVTSPGLERTLRRRRHFEKAVGREVRVKTKRPVEGSNHLRGLLAAVGADELTMETDGGQVTVPFDEVATARTVFVWEAAPKPGGRR